jgi:hypothetical protein
MKLANLFWFIIPSGLIIFFAYLGFKLFEVIDRAYPSF